MGVQHAGGVSIGLLPDSDPKEANNFVTIPIATGIGVARNALISQAALCLITIGGGYGTLSEIAYGLQFGKTVFGMGEEPPIAGMMMLQSVDELMSNICKIVMNLANLNT